jgi:signal transduction histidine kinase
MLLKKICQQLNFAAQCKKYYLPLWQCPSFLFFLTGLITISAMLATYLVAIKYAQPEIVALIVIGVTTIFITTGHFIVQGFERLAQANQMKSEFVSIVSHQLRTPLSGIKWTINLMTYQSAEKLSKEQLEKLEMIRENNQRMINLVNDLLNVSRIEQGKLGLRPEKVSLGKITQDLIKEYDLLAKASNIQLSLQIEPNLPLVLTDPQRIKLVLGNLINNALRYTQKEGWVKINLMKKGNLIRCEVQDNGVGIPKEDQKKIFQKFFRSQNIMKYQTEGTGLGLFIAKAFIKASQGKMGFWSKEGKGSTFWFEIPIKS